MLFKYFVIKLGFLERKFKKKLLTHITLPAFKCVRHCVLKDTRLLARKSGGGVFGFCCFSNLTFFWHGSVTACNYLNRFRARYRGHSKQRSGFILITSSQFTTLSETIH